MKYGGKDPFISKAIDNLNQLHAGSRTAQNIIDDLINSKSTTKIEEVNNTGSYASPVSNARSMRIASYFNNSIDSTTLVSLLRRDTEQSKNGTNVFLNYSKPALIPTQNGMQANNMITTIHELIHAWYNSKGAGFPGNGRIENEPNKEYSMFYIDKLNLNEILTSNIENQVRGEINLPLRTHYLVQPDQNGNLYGYPPELLKLRLDTSRIVQSVFMPKPIK